MYKLIEIIIDCIGTETKFKKENVGSVVLYQYDSKIYLPHYKNIGELLDETIIDLGNKKEKISELVIKKYLEFEKIELEELEGMLVYLREQSIQLIIIGEQIKEKLEFESDYKENEISFEEDFVKELKLELKEYNLKNIYK
jgi:hypothetical protein